jgi:drug/metabolite transporter (DMT)-like permease
VGHAVAAGLAYAVHFGAWVTSLGLTTVAASVTIVTATPLLLGIVALLTGRDRPDRRHWLAIALALAGLATIGGHDWGLGASALAGDGLAALGAAAMACYLLLGRRLGGEMDVWAYSGLAVAVGSAALFAFAALRGAPLLPASGEAFAYLLLAALVPQLVGHGLLTWSLRHTRPTVVGIATVGEPIGATALAWLWLGERVPPLVAVGCAVVLVAVVVAVLEPRASGGQ